MSIAEEYTKLTKNKIVAIFILIFIMFFIVAISATLGSYRIDLHEVYVIVLKGLTKPLCNVETSEKYNVIWNLRLPRIIMGVIAGFALACSGAAIQSILRNPLASPFTIGINSAAGFGATLAICLGSGVLSDYLIAGNAFLFSLIQAFLMLGIARYKGVSPETLILAGVAMSYIYSALTTLILFFSEPDAVKEAYFWMVGSLSKATWKNVPISFAITVAAFPILLWKAWDLNLIISAGDEVAKSLGVDVEKTCIVVMITSALLTSGVICFTGNIPFVCLVTPHICRILVGNDNRFLIPASGLLGSTIVLIADIISRRLIAPVILPIGAVLSFVGGPFFLYLLLKKRRKYW